MDPIREWRGLDNRNRPEDIGVSGLVVADNVDMTRSKRVRVRPGLALAVGALPDAAWGDAGHLLWQAGGTLSQMTPGGPKALATGLASTGSLWAVPVNGTLYWSNGRDTGAIDGQGNRPWGVDPPPRPVRVDEIPGAMPPGRYMLTLTHMRADGYESGAEAALAVDVTLGGLSVTVEPSGHAKALYLSTGDGDALMRAAVAPGEQTTLTFTADASALRLPLRDQWTRPPPAGHLMTRHRGRILIAEGNTLWATRPLAFESVDMRRDYLQMPGRITLLAGMEGGVFIGGEFGVVWAAGQDFQDLTLNTLSDAPPIFGSQAVTDAASVGEGRPGDCVMWATPRGMWAGFEDGSAQALTERTLSLPAPSAACGFVRRMDGQTHYLCGL